MPVMAQTAEYKGNKIEQNRRQTQRRLLPSPASTTDSPTGASLPSLLSTEQRPPHTTRSVTGGRDGDTLREFLPPVALMMTKAKWFLPPNISLPVVSGLLPSHNLVNTLCKLAIKTVDVFMKTL